MKRKNKMEEKEGRKNKNKNKQKRIFAVYFMNYRRADEKGGDRDNIKS